MKPQPSGIGEDGQILWKGEQWADAEIEEASPYGMVGDRLWVKETFYCDHYAYPEGSTAGVTVPDGYGGRRPLNIDEMRADMLELMYYRADVGDDAPVSAAFEEHEGEANWRPSIFMPRWASRLTLEIVRVRVERLHEITEEDAVAEGCWALGDADCTACRQYQQLWKKLNGRQSWEVNPWVWVIEFSDCDTAP